MRLALPAALSLLLILGAFAPPAAAQGQESCSESTPCDWVFEIDADGFVGYDDGETAFAGSLGDWYVFDVVNLDDRTHRLSVDGLGIAFDAPALGEDAGQGNTVYGPFELDGVGAFEVADDVTGRTLAFEVVEGDVIDEGQGDVGPGDGASGDGEGDNGSPGPALVVLLVAVLAAAAVAARRR